MTINPPLIQLGESATLSIEVRDAKKIQPPALPDIPGLRFASAGQSQHSSWVNGKSESFTAFNFQVYPQKTGTFTIGPFAYTLNGETKTLQGELKVVATSGDAAQPQSWSDIVFARLAVDRQNAFVQEPFGMTLSIYSRQGVQMAGNINLQGMPETGLGELKWQEMQPDRQVISNVVYDVRRFQTRTRAVSSGTFEFSPVVTVQVVVPNQNNRSNDPFFGSFFQRTETRPVDLPVEKTVIAVKPLPDQGKPAGFSGAVGRFDFQVSAQPLEIHPGDPVTLTMIISGNGNFDRVMSPSLPTNGLFRFFGEPVRKQEDRAVTFEQVISPRSSDVKEIPAIAFSFFDTQFGQYRTVNSKPIPITVSVTSNSTAQVFAAKDSIAGQKFLRIRQGDTARVRRQKAPKAARKALRAAEQARRQGNVPAFYDSLWNALADYFGHRLNLPPGDVTSSTVLQAMSRAGFDPEQISALGRIFEQVEASRYGLPGTGSPESTSELQGRLEQILKLCEKTKF